MNRLRMVYLMLVLSSAACDRENLTAHPEPALPEDPAAPARDPSAAVLCSADQDCKGPGAFCDTSMCASCCPPPAPGAQPTSCISACCGYCSKRDPRMDELAGRLQASPPVESYSWSSLSLNISADGSAHGSFSAKRLMDPFYVPLAGTIAADGKLEVEGARGADKLTLRGTLTAEGLTGTLVVETTEGERFESDLLPAHGTFKRQAPGAVPERVAD